MAPREPEISKINKLEIFWTVIPAIFLTGVIVYGLRTWDKAMNVDTTNAMVVEVYAKQFDWTARYSGEDNKLGYANYKLVEGPNQLGVDLEDINAATIMKEADEKSPTTSYDSLGIKSL